MTLVDTSIWIDHFRCGNPGLSLALQNSEVITHPFIIGEIACGNLRQRTDILFHLQKLPRIEPVSEMEFFTFINARQLSGRGMGFVDLHLLAAAKVNRTRLWTLDTRLARHANHLLSRH